MHKRVAAAAQLSGRMRRVKRTRGEVVLRDNTPTVVVLSPHATSTCQWKGFNYPSSESIMYIPRVPRVSQEDYSCSSRAAVARNAYPFNTGRMCARSLIVYFDRHLLQRPLILPCASPPPLLPSLTSLAQILHFEGVAVA